jgi:hypothetical protein
MQAQAWRVPVVDAQGDAWHDRAGRSGGEGQAVSEGELGRVVSDLRAGTRKRSRRADHRGGAKDGAVTEAGRRGAGGAAGSGDGGGGAGTRGPRREAGGIGLVYGAVAKFCHQTAGGGSGGSHAAGGALEP